MRPDSFIESEYLNFQKRVLAAHGANMDTGEVTNVIAGLLKAHREDMLKQHIRSYLPCELVTLAGIVEQGKKAEKVSIAVDKKPAKKVATIEAL